MNDVPLLEVDEFTHSLFIGVCTLEEVESHSNSGVVDVATVLDKFEAWGTLSRWSQGPCNIELVKVNTLKEMTH